MGDSDSKAFSLSIASSSQPARKKLKISESDSSGRRELVTSIDQPLTYRFIPKSGDIQEVGNGADRFETAAQEVVKTEVKYGLNLMRQGDTAIAAVKAEVKEEPASNGNAGESFTMEGQIERAQQVLRSKGWETEAFNKDILKLPDVGTLEDYEDMPVDFFGEAMLKGMGWKGPDAAEAQPVQYVRRPQLLGLGARPAMPTHDKKDPKDAKHSGRPQPEKKDLVVYDKQGNIKHTMTEGDKLVERRKQGPQEGKWMRILKGQHEGLRCKVLTMHEKKDDRSQKATVKLHPSEEKVTVRLKELGEVDEKSSSNGMSSKERERDSKRSSKESKRHESDSQQARDRSSEEASRSARYEAKDSAARDESRRREPVLEPIREESEGPGEPWLTPHIRVKIIDKKIGKGRHYLKKGEVTDVTTPHECTVHLDTGERIEVSDSQIETNIPKKEGARVLILLGPYARKRAKLLHRSLQSSVAALQLTEDYAIVKCDFSEFAEYVGDFGEEE